MTAPALFEGGPVQSTVRVAQPPVTTSSRLSSNAGLLVGAAALLALAEILVDRVGAVLVAYLAPSQPGVAGGVAAAGSGVAGAAAVLVVLAAFAVVFGLETSRLGIAVLPVAAGLGVLASVTGGKAALGALNASVIVGAGVLALTPGRRGLMRAGVVSAAGGVALGQVVLLVPALGDSAVVRFGAEAGLLAAPVLVAASWFGSGASLSVRLAGVTTAVSVAALMLVRPGFAALFSTWSLGMTLSLPLVLYVAAAGALGMLTAGALGNRRVRLVAAGVALLWVAGTVPTAVHHNVSALLGVFLMTQALIGDSDAEESDGRCPS